jgi:hypothetical protein
MNGRLNSILLPPSVVLLILLSAGTIHAGNQARVKHSPASPALNFISADHLIGHEFISSQKENVQTQLTSQKIKGWVTPIFQTRSLRSRSFHSILHTLLTHSFLLGSSSSFRAPPVVLG